MLMDHSTELAIAELQAGVEALWRAKDLNPSSVSMSELLKLQVEADTFLGRWATGIGISCNTPEERADALIALRRKNAEVVMGGVGTAERTPE